MGVTGACAEEGIGTRRCGGWVLCAPGCYGGRVASGPKTPGGIPGCMVLFGDAAEAPTVGGGERGRNGATMSLSLTTDLTDWPKHHALYSMPLTFGSFLRPFYGR